MIESYLNNDTLVIPANVSKLRREERKNIRLSFINNLRSRTLSEKVIIQGILTAIIILIFGVTGTIGNYWSIEEIAFISLPILIIAWFIFGGKSSKD